MTSLVVAKRAAIAGESLFPLIALIQAAGFVLFAHSNEFAFISIAAAIVSIYSVWMSIAYFRRKELNVIRLGVYQMFLWYAMPIAYVKFVDMPGLLYITEKDMADAFMLVAASLTIAWCGSFILNITVKLDDSSGFLRPRDVFLLLAPLCVFQLALLATGVWSYDTLHASGVMTAHGMEAVEAEHNPLQILAANITPGIAPMVAYNFGLLSSRQRNALQWFVLIAAMSVQGLFWFVESRRSLMIEAVVSLAVYLASRGQAKMTLRQVVTVAVTLAVLGAGLSQAGKAFYAMRMASGTLGTQAGQTASLSDWLAAAGNISEESLSAELKLNETQRPFIIQSVSVVQRTAHGFLYGKELLMQIINVIPAGFFPNKAQYTSDIGTQEDLWNKDLAVPFDDYANTFVLDGYADFSYFGCLIYSYVAALLFYGMYKLYNVVGNKTALNLCVFAYAMNLFSAEKVIGGALVASRDFFILLCFVALSQFVFEVARSATAGRRQPRRHDMPPQASS